MMAVVVDSTAQLQNEFQKRNDVFEAYVSRHAVALADTCREMADRFLRGGRLLAVGMGPYATDAQHVAVEFMHPIIVGKRALPALDLSHMPHALATLAGPDDIVMGFSSPQDAERLAQFVLPAVDRHALVCLWPGQLGATNLPAVTDDPFMHQEVCELMYHTLWETVHVFFEQQGRGEDVGAASFLYPFLGNGDSADNATRDDVARSIIDKCRQGSRLRDRFASDQSDSFLACQKAIQARIDRGGTLLAFGNGGTATDANDLALDCLEPLDSDHAIPAISLAADPAVLSAIGNDVGVELTFLRQLIAVARPQDVAIAISTSGKSRNVSLALVEARKRGLLTVALVGYDGGDIVRERLADHVLLIASDYVPRIQEVQASVYHILRRGLRGSGQS